MPSWQRYLDGEKMPHFSINELLFLLYAFLTYSSIPNLGNTFKDIMEVVLLKKFTVFFQDQVNLPFKLTN